MVMSGPIKRAIHAVHMVEVHATITESANSYALSDTGDVQRSMPVSEILARLSAGASRTCRCH